MLPEECYNRQVDVSSNTRDEFIEQLAQSSGDVLTFLSNLWVSVSSADKAVKSKILKCSENWLKITNISSTAMLAQPIYQYILESLQDPDLFLEAVESVVAILHKFKSHDLDILQSLIPAIMNLQQKWQDLITHIIPSELKENDIPLDANYHR